MKPQELIDILTERAPCAVTEKLPRFYRPMRTCYYPGERLREPIIYMNERRHGWEYVQNLAHEVGHALDYAGLHPLRNMLPGRKGCASHSRYRSELAAVAYEFMTCQEFTLHRMKLVRGRLYRSIQYVTRYARKDNPSLEQLVPDIWKLADRDYIK